MPLINKTSAILNKFGDSSVFFSDVRTAIHLMIEGDLVTAKAILSKYIKFTLLDDSLGYQINPALRAQRLSDTNYFIHGLNDLSVNPLKLLLSEDDKLDFH